MFWVPCANTSTERPGDRLSLTTECLEARPSSSKPDRGIVRTLITLNNQNGEAVLSAKEAILVARKPSP